MKVRPSMMIFIISSITGLCALILDIFTIYNSIIDIVLDYIRYAAGGIIVLLILYMGFIHGDEKQWFWTKLSIIILLFTAIAFAISFF